MNGSNQLKHLYNIFYNENTINNTTNKVKNYELKNPPKILTKAIFFLEIVSRGIVSFQCKEFSILLKYFPLFRPFQLTIQIPWNPIFVIIFLRRMAVC